MASDTGFSGAFNKLLDGAKQAANAPIGLVTDFARAIGDPDQGVGDAFAGFGQNFLGGVGSFASGIGTGVEEVGRITGLEGAAKTIFDEMELIWNSQYQQQMGQIPHLLQGVNELTGTNFEPGDLSVSRVAGTAAGTIGDIAVGGISGQPMNTPKTLWERTADRSVGQSFMDEAIGLEAMAPAEATQARSSLGYKFTSGTVDAVARWYLEADVVLGKGIKRFREYRSPTVEQAISRAKVRHPKMEFEAVTDDPISGARNLRVRDAKGQKLYHVTRQSNLDSLQDQGLLKVPPGTDEVEYLDTNLGDILAHLGEDRDLGTSPLFARLDQKLNTVLDDPDSAHFVMMQNLMREGLGPQEALARAIFQPIIEGATQADLAAGRRGLPTAARISSLLDNGGLKADDVPTLLNYADPEDLEDVKAVVAMMAHAQHRTDRKLFMAGRGAGGGDPAGVFNTPPVSPGNAIYLLGEDDFGEAMRYAAALAAKNSDDMPVIIVLNPDGLPVTFEELDPRKLDPRSGIPSDASLYTTVDKIAPENIEEVRHLGDLELDGGRRLDAEIPDYLVPGGRVHSRLFDANGDALEPYDLVDPFWADEQFKVSVGLYNENPEAARRYMTRVAAIDNQARNPNTPANRLLGRRDVREVINWVDGKSADQIRRRIFDDTVHGAVLSDALSQATTYAERELILKAGMGFDDPLIETLSPRMRIRIESLTADLKKVKAEKSIVKDRWDEMIEAGMVHEQADFDQQISHWQRLQDDYKEQLEEAVRLKRLDENLQQLRDTAPIKDVPQLTLRKGIREAARSTSFYQKSPLARPIRSVVERKPRQFVNLHDPEGDLQVVRQLEQAQVIGVTADDVSKYRNQYMAARSEHERSMVLWRMDDLVIKRAAEHAGLDPDEIEELVRNARAGKQNVQDFLRSRRYDGQGRDIVKYLDDETGEAIELALPLLGTQLQNWVPLSNVQEVIRQASKVRRYKARFGAVPREILDSFNSLWKPAVLLRGGWPIRVVVDEQLRILARTGSLFETLAAIEAGEKIKLRGMLKNAPDLGTKVGRITASPAALATKVADTGASTASWVARKMGLVDKDLYAKMVDAGTEKLASARSTFGGPNESVLREFEALLGHHEAGILDHLASHGTGEFTSIGPTSRYYGDAWRRALKDQIGRDPLGQFIPRRLLELEDIYQPENVDDLLEYLTDDVVNWMKKNPDYVNRMPWRKDDLQAWAADVIGMVGDYTAQWDKRLLTAVRDNKVSVELLGQVEEAWRPVSVHAEVIDQTLGRSEVMAFMKDMMSAQFDFLGRLPTDTLSRQPFFRWNFAHESQRLEKIWRRQGREINERARRVIQARARDYALKEVTTYLYNLGESSRFGHMMRFWMPFYPAWQEVLTVWGRLAKQDPSVIARGRLIWQSPDKAGLTVTDDDGNSFIQLQLAEQTADQLELTGWKRYIATGGVRLGKSSFNMVTQSVLPGTGPLVQIPVNEVVLQKPELEESLQFILPYGARGGETAAARAFNITASPVIQRANAYLDGVESDRAFQRFYADVANWMDYRYRAGISSVPPTVEEVNESARKLFAIRTFANFTSPVQPIFDTPLKPYMDAYREMIETYGPENADERFINTFGEEFFAVTMSRTVSKTGLPPTVEAEVVRRQYDDLLAQYPEFGRLIVGDENSVGEFSTAAYASQQSKRVDPKDPFSPRERETREIDIGENGRIVEVDKRLGWMAYTQGMDLFETQRISMGLPSYRVKEAEMLNFAKQAWMQQLSQQYPAWWEDFNQRDNLAWDKRMKAMRDISGSELITEDPSRNDMAGVRDYLAAREAIGNELNRRKQLGGSATLDAMANHDLATVWDVMVFKILSDNPDMAPIYFRYLEGDPVTAR